MDKQAGEVFNVDFSKSNDNEHKREESDKMATTTIYANSLIQSLVEDFVPTPEEIKRELKNKGQLPEPKFKPENTSKDVSSVVCISQSQSDEAKKFIESLYSKE